MADSRQIAERLSTALGAGNIIDIENCVTRLHVGVRDHAQVDVAALRATAPVLAVIPGRSFQIILGLGLVEKVARDMATLSRATIPSPRTAARTGAEQLAASGAAIGQANS